MTQNTKPLHSFLLVAIVTSGLLASTQSQSKDLKNAKQAVSRLAVASGMESQSARLAAYSAPNRLSMEQYCTAGNYLGHYYDNYYGNHDGREFFYFQRNWLAVCVK